MCFFSVAAQGDYVWVLAEEQDVWNGASFAGFDELMLECASWGVGQEARVYLPADFFWLVHEPLRTHLSLPNITWRTEVRRYKFEDRAKVKGARLKVAATTSKDWPPSIFPQNLQ
jgi:hypothetical protein